MNSVVRAVTATTYWMLSTCQAGSTARSAREQPQGAVAGVTAFPRWGRLGGSGQLVLPISARVKHLPEKTSAGVLALPGLPGPAWAEQRCTWRLPRPCCPSVVAGCLSVPPSHRQPWTPKGRIPPRLRLFAFIAPLCCLICIVGTLEMFMNEWINNRKVGKNKHLEK